MSDSNLINSSRITYNNINGNNNHIRLIRENENIEISPFNKIEGLSISIKGNNNMILIEEPYKFINSKICLDANNSFVKIGANSICNTLVILNNGGFSNRNVDGHSIFIEGQKISPAKDIYIGNHVWIGMGVYILKNSVIANNSIVGAGSVLAKKFEQENVAIAGNPAKIIKRNVEWLLQSDESYYLEHLNKN